MQNLGFYHFLILRCCLIKLEKKGLNKNTGNGKYELLCKAFVFNTYKFSRFVNLENVSFDMVLMRLLCRNLRKVTQKVCH